MKPRQERQHRLAVIQPDAVVGLDCRPGPAAMPRSPRWIAVRSTADQVR